MGKRILSLLLCLLMFGACLVGCNKDKDVEGEITNEASKKTETIAMHLMSEKEVSDAQAAAIQNAVNKITKSKFKTQLILHFYTEDEYYVALEQAYADKQNAGNTNQNNSNAAKDEEGSETAEETIVNEYGVTELKYPSIPDYQVDIFYLGGYEKLMEYIEKDMVMELTDEVSSASKKLKTFMTPGYLEGMDVLTQGIFAIPANEPVGEYTYMLLNKDIITKYHHVAGDFTSLLDKKTAWLLDVVKNNEPDYVPLRSFTPSGELDIANVGYFGIGDDGFFNNTEFSLLGGSYENNWQYLVEGQYVPCNNIFNSSVFTSQVRTLVDYRAKGYYGTSADANKDFAVGYIKGGIELIDEYSDKYEVIVVDTPKINSMDLFNHMFAVSSFSRSDARSMEIITYLYTNADFRNLLLYGIEGTNYELVESEMKDSNDEPYMVVKRLNEDYMMAPEKTGNVLLAIPTVDQAPNLRELYTKQNLDSSISLTMGFSHNYDQLQLSEEHVNHLREQSKIALEEIMNLESAAAFDAYVAAKKVAIREDAVLNAAMSPNKIENPVDPELDPYETLTSLYNAWLTANKLVPKID